MPQRHASPIKYMSSSQIRDLIFVRLSALGDVTLLLPVVQTLARALPQTRLTWLTSHPNDALVRGLPGVEMLVIDKPRSVADYLSLANRLRPRRFDVLLAMQASLRANLIYPLIRAPVKIGFDKARARDGQRWVTNRQISPGRDHLLDGFFRFTEALGIRERQLIWNLSLTDEDLRVAAALLPQKRPRLAVALSASKPERNWPLDRFIEVLRVAVERWNVQVVLTGGPGKEELARASTAALALGEAATNLTGQTTPKQLAAVLARVDCLLAPDTGPVHIAVAVGTPVVGLYAVAPSALSGPYLRRELTVDKYEDAVRQVLGKDPNSVPWGTRVHSEQAMALIEPSEVLAKLALVFERKAC